MLALGKAKKGGKGKLTHTLASPARENLMSRVARGAREYKSCTPAEVGDGWLSPRRRYKIKRWYKRRWQINKAVPSWWRQSSRGADADTALRSVNRQFFTAPRDYCCHRHFSFSYRLPLASSVTPLHQPHTALPFLLQIPVLSTTTASLHTYCIYFHGYAIKVKVTASVVCYSNFCFCLLS